MMHSFVEALAVYSSSGLLLHHPPEVSLLADLSPWLFPLGLSPLPSCPAPSPSAMVLFLVTDSLQVRRYCSCLQFYEQQDGQWVPFSLCLSSRRPAFLEHRQILAHLQQLLHQHPSVYVFQQHQAYLQQLLDKHPGQPSRAERVYNKETLQHLPQGGPVKSLPQVETLEFFLNFMTKQLPSSLSNQCTEVKGLFTLGKHQEQGQAPLVLSIRQTPGCPLLTVPDLSLFEELSVENVLGVVMALLCERQVIVLGEDANRVVMCLDALLSFIQPLQWSCVYIPHLPIDDSSMWHVLNTMVPFLVGCHSKHLPFIESSLEKLSSKVIVDTKQDVVYNLEQNVELPRRLIERSKKVLGRLVEKWQRNKGYKESLEIKQFFCTLMMTILDNYLLFYRPHRPRGSQSANDLFDHSSYLRAAPQHPLLLQMHQNMMFSLLIEETAQEQDSLPCQNPFLPQFMCMTQKLHQINLNNGPVFDLLFQPALLSTWEQSYFRDIKKDLLSDHLHPRLLHMQSLFNKFYFKTQDLPRQRRLSQLNEHLLALDLMHLFPSQGGMAHSASMVSHSSSRLRPPSQMIRKGITITVPTPENTHKVALDTPKTQMPKRDQEKSSQKRLSRGISTISQAPVMGRIKEQRQLLDKLTQNRFLKEGWEMEEEEPTIYRQVLGYLKEQRRWRPSILSRQSSPS